MKRSFWHAIGLALLPLALTQAAEPVDQAAAARAFGRYTTNIQFNRDRTVRLIRLSRPHVNDDALVALRQFPRLDYLAIVCPKVTDKGVAHIAGLTNLDTLLISGIQLTDAGVAHLSGLTKLERLYLKAVPVGDAGLKHLTGLGKLKTLSLEGTQVTDAGLAHLAQLTQLEVLVIAGTKVTDAGLQQLASLKNLRVLDLTACRIDGTGLKHLHSLEKLTQLRLTDTNIGPAAMNDLASLKSLKQIEAYRTKLTSADRDKLREKLPKTGVAVTRVAVVKPSAKSVETLPASHSSNANPGKLVASIRARLKPGKSLTESPDFQRHVVPLLGRLGCNGRSCHGSFQGQGGFRLSMFGYDFDVDHQNLAKRIDRKSPAKSLILNKPTSEDDHGGGLRLPPGGWEQSLLRHWIIGGAKNVAKDAPQFVRLVVEPREIVFAKPGQTVQLKATAVWSNGLREDVTCLTRFETKDDAVAEVSPDGLVTARGKGDTHVLSFYDNGLVATPTILPVSDRVGDNYPAVPTPTKIDELVIAKLKKLGITPSELCDDETFLRRVSLDLIGTLPTPAEIIAFKSDTHPDKRTRKIDELLERPAYVSWWTQRLCDLTGSNAGYLGGTEMAQPVAAQWRAWIERRVRDNVGWDQIVAGIVLARSRRPGQPYRDFIAEQSEFTRRKNPADVAADGNPLPHFWFRDNIRIASDKALAFGYTFMGVKLDCAQCHKHPFDQWSKRDFELFTQFFTRIKTGTAADALAQHNEMREMLGVPVKLNTAALRRQSYLRIAAEGRPIPWKEIYIEAPKRKSQPGKLLGGRTLNLAEYADPREPLMQWLRTEPNRYMARAFVNRIWASYFNVGIVDPPDDLNLANPPSNGPLLDHLTAGFIASGYDMKWLHRTIAVSRTYQLSFRPNATNRRDERNFSRAVLRRLPAEVAVDAMIQATAQMKDLAKSRYVVTGRKIGQHPKSYQTRSIDFSLLIFGKSLRTTNCDCERQMEPTLLQALYVRNDQEMIDRLDRPDGWINELKRRKPDASKLDDLIRTAYLRTLSRQPDEAELADCREHVQKSKNMVDGLRDLMWALLNTREFITNH